MSGLDETALIVMLVKRYPDLEHALALRLGSPDQAADALHDAYLKLHGNPPRGIIKRPRAYLIRMALNIASNRRRSATALLSAAQVDALIDLPDEQPDPGRIAEARSDLAAVVEALATLPARRRSIFLRAWKDGLSHQAIASEFDIAVRTVRHELQLATRHLHSATRDLSTRTLQHRLAEVSS